MDVLALFAGIIIFLYLITRKWFWMSLLILAAIGLLFTPLASVMALAMLVVGAFVILHIVFMALMFILSSLFLFS